VNRVRRLIWSYLALLLLAWSLGEFVAERSLPTLLVAYAPPALLTWPAPLLLLAALAQWRVKKSRRAVLPALLACGAALLFLGFTWHPARSSQPGDLSVLTYNIARGRLGSAERLSAQLRAGGTDIITLQETNGVRWPFTDTLLSGLPGYFVSRSGTPGAELLTLSRFPVVSTREISLPGTTRRFLVTRLRTPQGDLSVINVHFSTVMFSRVLDGQVQTTRRNRQNQLDILRREAAAVRGPLIVAGDFNTPSRGRIYRALAAQFADAWDAAGRGLGYTFASAQPSLRIDHVFARGLKVVSAEVQLPGGSDHRALAARLRGPNISPVR